MHDDLHAAIGKILKAANAAGKKAGIFCTRFVFSASFFPIRVFLGEASRAQIRVVRIVWAIGSLLPLASPETFLVLLNPPEEVF